MRMMKEHMFDVIPLSRYNHLVGNGGSKVWAKRTADSSAVDNKDGMSNERSRYA